AVRTKHDEAMERPQNPFGQRLLQARRVDAVALVERGRDRREYTSKLHLVILPPRRPASCARCAAPRLATGDSARGRRGTSPPPGSAATENRRTPGCSSPRRGASCPSWRSDRGSRGRRTTTWLPRR